MLNFNRYEELKKKGLVSLAKIGSAHAVSVKKFDAETGQEVASEVASVELEKLINQRAGLAKSLEGLDKLIEEIKALK